MATGPGAARAGTRGPAAGENRDSRCSWSPQKREAPRKTRGHRHPAVGAPTARFRVDVLSDAALQPSHPRRFEGFEVNHPSVLTSLE